MRLISILMSLMIFLSSSVISFAEDRVKSYKFEKDITMSGVISSTEKFFKVSDNWNIKDAKLNLALTKSELLDVDYSTITIIVNNTPIHSEKLDGKKEYKKQVEIDIPKDVIKPGYNSLVIKGYKTISDMVCRDDSNTANWLVVHKESNINVKYEYNNTDMVVSEYPNIFMDIGDGDELNTNIVVPDNYTDKELSAAMNLSLDIGKKLKHDNFKFNTLLKSEFKEDKNSIYISSLKNISSDMLALLTKEEINTLKNQAIIKLVDNPKNKANKILLIISENEELLIKSTKLLSSDNLIKNLNKNSIYINENTDVDDLNKEKSDNKIYLEELGYSDILVKGPFSQEVTFDISIPKNKLATDGTSLNLNMRYAKNLDFERSLVTAYINEVPIGSKKLSSEKADNDSLFVNLPKDVIENNYYQIKVVFNLELLDLQCVTRDTDNPWAYILNNSYINFNYKDNKSLNFKSYPYPFVDNKIANNINIVLPNILGSTDLTYVSNIIANIGRELEYNNGNINVIKDTDFIKNKPQGNAIVIGTPSNNSVIKDINKDLYIKFDDSFNGFESNDKIKFVGDYNSEIATIQLIKSPYSKGNSAMVISSINNRDIGLAANYLSKQSLTNSITGDAFTVDRNGYTQDLDFNKIDKEEEADKEISKKTINKDIKIFILVAVFVLITLIVSIVLLLFKYKK